MNTILVFNCGSSSIKFALVDPHSGEKTFHGLVEKIHSEDTALTYHFQTQIHEKKLPGADYEQAMQAILAALNTSGDSAKHFQAVGHRVVHGGDDFTQSVIIDQNVINKITACVPLAPLHNPANLLGIKLAQTFFPDIPHVAVFDTAFHQTMPEIAYLYPLPYKYYEKHRVRRYGFHGTSHSYVTQKAAKFLKKPIEKTAFISAHLGNGCSLASVLNGKSIDTTMGFTPLEGLMMGTRSGDIDPGMMTYLTKTLSCTLDELTDILNKKSGLLGVSGLSMDMRALSQAAQEGHEHAQLAIDMYCYRLAKHIASSLISLGRLDALIFTGGIGENAKNIRQKTLEWLKPLGFKLDEKHNDNHGKNNHHIITQNDSITAMVIPTNEEWMIAKDTLELTS